MQVIYVTLTALTVLSTTGKALNFITDEFIESINKKQTTWVAGRNFPEDTPVEELKRLNGARAEPGHVKARRSKVHRRSSISIPERFDAREAWPHCESIGTVRNQGYCGSCWAYCAVEVMTDRLCIATAGDVKFDFSPGNVISCCDRCGSCIGGSVPETFDYWISDGIVSGGDFNSLKGCQPYEVDLQIGHSTDLACKTNCLNWNYTISYDEDKRYGSSAYYVPSEEEQIQIEVMTNGPVTVMFAVYEDFFAYQSGVYQHVSGNDSGAHSVKLLGWGVEEDGTPYWLLANSWGFWWGEMDGFLKFLRGQDHCNIESDVFAGLPRL